ncbi:uncharacterized protein LOC126891495 [Diabrotica virgifera virgifera]|uniref:Uncharacterized protein LOC114346087 n=1 Tax=Diabrotica virgifera virgifera TaxID=50390 RepID=A0A6P7H4S5_DIAVI|nr:uncharacterized protein LOC126891495 [Diabrotica virgifera virgifera]
MEEIIIYHENDVQEASAIVKTVDYVVWTTNQTKVLIYLYRKYKPKVGTLQIRNLKKLWELIANEINKNLLLNVSPSHSENKWRVLERGYKKFIDNQNKTGRGRKFFEFKDEIDSIFKKRGNVHPEILASTSKVIKRRLELKKWRILRVQCQ